MKKLREFFLSGLSVLAMVIFGAGCAGMPIEENSWTIGHTSKTYQCPGGTRINYTKDFNEKVSVTTVTLGSGASQYQPNQTFYQQNFYVGGNAGRGAAVIPAPSQSQLGIQHLPNPTVTTNQCWQPGLVQPPWAE
ncbi:MAG: hypothetical protein WCO10_00035 [bacterium]